MTGHGPALFAQVDELVASNRRDEADYDLLRSELDALPAGRRGRRWRRASILLDVSFRRRPGKVFTQLGRMRDRLDPGEFDALWSECQQLMAPHTLGPHGYKLALSGVPDRQLWHDVGSIVTQIAGLGHECFVNAGTLLGLVRQGSLLGHDDDVDLAVLLRGGDAASAASEWAALRGRLAEHGLLDLEFEARPRLHAKARVVHDVGVDLFPAWISNGRLYLWPHTFGEVPAGDVLPLITTEVEGVTVPLPRRPESLLVSNYGPEWRTPDPTFRFDWRAARNRFADFRGHYRGGGAHADT